VFASRANAGDPDREAGRVRQDLDVAAVVPVLPAPPQAGVVRALHRDAAGVDEGAVEVEVGGPGRARGEDRLVYARGEGGEQAGRLV